MSKPRLRLAYFVSRLTRQPHKRSKLETKSGILRLCGYWEDDETHDRIRQRIRKLCPGWDVGGYTLNKTITPIVDAKGFPVTIL